MKKLIAIIAVLFASNALAVVGESLDSGLGALPSNYTAGEYNYMKKSDGTVEWPFAI